MLIETITIRFFYIYTYHYFSSKNQGVILPLHQKNQIQKPSQPETFLLFKQLYNQKAILSRFWSPNIDVSIMKSTNCEQRLNFDFKNIFFYCKLYIHVAPWLTFRQLVITNVPFVSLFSLEALRSKWTHRIQSYVIITCMRKYLPNFIQYHQKM